jgi:hypothetical protein
MRDVQFAAALADLADRGSGTDGRCRTNPTSTSTAKQT